MSTELRLWVYSSKVYLIDWYPSVPVSAKCYTTPGYSQGGQRTSRVAKAREGQVINAQLLDHVVEVNPTTLRFVTD